MTELRRRFTYRDAGLVMLWALLAINAVGLILSFVAVGLKQEHLTEDIVVSGLCTNVALLVAYFGYTLVRGIPLRESGITRPFRWWIVPIALVLLPLLQYAMFGTMTLADQWLRSMGYESVNSIVQTDFGANGALGYVLYGVVTCVLTGFAEELVFRGAILNGLRARFGPVSSVLLCGALFSLFHCSPDQTVFQFAFGCMLALLTVQCGSVVPAMICHAANNALSIVFSATGFAFPLPTQTGWLVVVAVAGLAVAAFVIPLVIHTACGSVRSTWWLGGARKQDGEGEKDAPKEKGINWWLVLACGICVALWISQLILGFAG